MTIPHINGDNSNFGKNNDKFVEINYSDEELPILKNNTTPKLTQNNTKEAELDVKPVSNNKYTKDNTDEDNINNFISVFSKVYIKTVAPILRTYEKERIIRLILATILNIGILAATITILVGIFANSETPATIKDIMICTFEYMLIAGIIMFFITKFIKKTFEKKVKKRIMPLLMQAFPSFSWTERQIISDSEFCDAMFVDKMHRYKKTIDDNFKGSYKKVPIEITECDLERHEGYGKNRKIIKLFKGVIIKIQMNKQFSGTTVVTPKNFNGFINDMNFSRHYEKCGLRKVSLEDPEFNKKFNVYSTDQIEARYLLTTTFMERLKKISLAFHSSKIKCSFNSSSVYLGPKTNKDLFCLCNLTKPMDDIKQFQTLLNQFVSILELIDHFKLDKNIGL